MYITKRIVVFCILLVLLLGVFISCNKSSYVEELNNSNIIIGDENDSGNVTENKIINDLVSNDTFQNCYTDKYTYSSPYNITEFVIEKRQINNDDKMDMIYCNINAINDYFCVTFDAELEYNLYDVGGWILDEVKIKNKSVRPIAPAEAELLINDMAFEDDLGKFTIKRLYIDIYNENGNLLEDVNILIECESKFSSTTSEEIAEVTEYLSSVTPHLDTEVMFDETGIITTRAYAVVDHPNVSVEAFFDAVFTEQGWSIQNKSLVSYPSLFELKYNLSDLIGVYKNTYQFLLSSWVDVNEFLYIDEIDVNNMTITFRFYETLNGTNISRTEFFNAFTPYVREVKGPHNIKYNFENDTWSFYDYWDGGDNIYYQLEE